MGFYIRKSKSFGPFRINLSKHGLGVSTGVKGARVSTGPRGTYVHLGRNGLYYREKIGKKKRHHSKAKRTKANNASKSYSYYNGNTSNTRVIQEPINFSFASESVCKERCEEKLLKSIKSTRIIRKLLLFIAIILGGSVLLELLKPIILLPAALLLITILFVKGSITYDLNEHQYNNWDETINNLMELCSSKSLILIIDNRDDETIVTNEFYTYDFKHIGVVESGSNTARIRCNYDMFAMVADIVSIYFLPSCIVVIDKKNQNVFSYRYLYIKHKDAIIVGELDSNPDDVIYYQHTWEHMTKDGGPDLRYNDNTMYTASTYGNVLIKSPTGMYLNIGISNYSISKSFEDTLNNYIVRYYNINSGEQADDIKKNVSSHKDKEFISNNDSIVGESIKSDLLGDIEELFIRDDDER